MCGPASCRWSSPRESRSPTRAALNPSPPTSPHMPEEMHSSNLNWLLAHVREDELRRTAERRARARAGAISGTRSRTTPPADAAVTLRFAFPDDAVALTRLATLDSATPPSDPVLLAEVSGELRAAL